MSIRVILIFLILGYVGIQLLIKKMKPLDGYAFLLAFPAIGFDFGLGVNASLVVLLFLILLIILTVFEKARITPFFNGLTWPVVLFLTYAIIDTVIISTTSIGAIQVNDDSFLRNEGRFIFQIIRQCLSFSVFLVVPNYVKNRDDLLRTVSFFMKGLILLALLGVVQQIIFVLTSIDIIPMMASNDIERVNQQYGYFGVPMIRICSFGGEPKGFAQLLVIAFYIVTVYETF